MKRRKPSLITPMVYLRINIPYGLTPCQKDITPPPPPPPLKPISKTFSLFRFISLKVVNGGVSLWIGKESMFVTEVISSSILYTPYNTILVLSFFIFFIAKIDKTDRYSAHVMLWKNLVRFSFIVMLSVCWIHTQKHTFGKRITSSV